MEHDYSYTKRPKNHSVLKEYSIWGQGIERTWTNIFWSKQFHLECIFHMGEGVVHRCCSMYLPPPPLSPGSSNSMTPITKNGLTNRALICKQRPTRRPRLPSLAWAVYKSGAHRWKSEERQTLRPTQFSPTPDGTELENKRRKFMILPEAGGVMRPLVGMAVIVVLVNDRRC